MDGKIIILKMEREFVGVNFSLQCCRCKKRASAFRRGPWAISLCREFSRPASNYLFYVARRVDAVENRVQCVKHCGAERTILIRRLENLEHGVGSIVREADR